MNNFQFFSLFMISNNSNFDTPVNMILSPRCNNYYIFILQDLTTDFIKFIFINGEIMYKFLEFSIEK